jgi:hypothetical protein
MVMQVKPCTRCNDWFTAQPDGICLTCKDADAKNETPEPPIAAFNTSVREWLTEALPERKRFRVSRVTPKVDDDGWYRLTSDQWDPEQVSQFNLPKDNTVPASAQAILNIKPAKQLTPKQQEQGESIQRAVRAMTENSAIIGSFQMGSR